MNKLKRIKRILEILWNLPEKLAFLLNKILEDFQDD